ncbi:uncharacterized protein LOC111796929 isoform X2 [Cucurbita pepo subsp. pepo]|uniref:uncharacterized protein LOC111796929 isoform X2 n=1 Tax=Cucurbita pepo subsp. pepo TaxID=3664 RepID=UPI000C9D8342|nr:uncharacterized protein LOC111796929 isoform X2 [Cucurbita pepo subsp. pepo]
MEGAVGDEFQDWEVLLHDSNAETAVTAAKFSGEKSTHFGGIEEFLQGDDELSGRIQKLESLESHDTKIELAFEEFDETQSQSKDLRNFWSDSGGSEVVKEHLEENKNIEIEETKANDESGCEVGDKRKVVWWKVPLEVLKYCLFKASPVWSFSVAAAVMGFIILGRRLYRMKRKTQSLNLKVILDEKKGSPFMSRAARLNEAFSVVRRVPIVRPALPAAGINPWPAMSMS